LSYAEVKAIASGNPAVLTLAEANAELQRLNLLKKQHMDEQYVARRSLRDLPPTIARLAERLNALTADMETSKAHEHDRITIGSRTCSGEEVLATLGQKMDTLPQNARDTRRVAIGIYRGLRFGLVLHPQCAPDVYLDGAAVRQSGFLSDSHGPRAVLNAVERLAKAYETDCARVRQDLAIAEGQLRDYQARIGQPFAHDSYLAELAALRDQLKSALSGAVAEAGAEPGPTVSELAQRINSLKASHTILATPERIGTRPSASAEEPVTARILRRMPPNPAMEADAASPVVVPLAQPATDQHHNRQAPKMATSLETHHREQVIAGRRYKDAQLSLF
ncbi:MAG TPA: hypothetical protein VE988_10290, partial [Gemmataceae bacterium]|nr:hypothetical protein [Gemmataceae bacterium]